MTDTVSFLKMPYDEFNALPVTERARQIHIGLEAIIPTVSSRPDIVERIQNAIDLKMGLSEDEPDWESRIMASSVWLALSPRFRRAINDLARDSAEYKSLPALLGRRVES